MKKALNYVRGSIRVEVECLYPERFVNVCAKNDLEFWDLERVSKTAVRVTMHIGGCRKLTELSAGSDFTVRPVKKTGVPFFLWKIRKRYVLLAGMLLCFASVWVLSLFIWEMDVYGNEKVPTHLILEELDAIGIKIGSFGPSIVSEAVSNEILLRIPELSWIAVNVYGSHMDVLVRERVPIPEIVDENKPMMVYATKSGIIAKMSVLEGKTLKEVGDTVVAGDIIVTGVMDSIASGKRLVHAMADVTARTWYELSAQMTLPTTLKSYTGKTETKTAVIFAGSRINLYFNSGISWQDYDKITVEKTLMLPTGNVLPIRIVTETYKEYDPVEAKLSVFSAEEILKARLMSRLNAEISNGEVVKTDFATTVENGVVTVTLKAECLERIAAERDFTEEELMLGVNEPAQPEESNKPQ
jgi:similar to stage IV sporulation protein